MLSFVAALTVVWLGLFLYAARLWLAQRRLNQQFNSLQSRRPPEAKTSEAAARQAA